MLSKNGMLVNVPFLVEHFIQKLELDAKQERKMSMDEFERCVGYFRLSMKDTNNVIEDLRNYGVIEEYNKRKREIIFR